jgi:hypothetical protein
LTEIGLVSECIKRGNMGLFRGDFGKRRKKKIIPAGTAVNRSGDPSKDPNLIWGFDKYR